MFDQDDLSDYISQSLDDPEEQIMDVEEEFFAG